MAVASTMMRTASAAPPSIGARVPVAGPAAAADISAPVAPLHARGGLFAGDGSFTYDTLSADARGGHARFSQPDPLRERNLDTALFTASSEIFAMLFAPHPQYSISPGLPGGAGTRAAIQEGIERYELVSAVIHDELAPRGEQLTVTV